MSIASDISDLKDLSDGVVANKVSRFAYTEQAYTDNEVDGVIDYDVNRGRNIPVGTASVMKVNQTVIEKGWRARASSITRMLMNHFLGRISYNLNKLNDWFNSYLSSMLSYLGAPNGIATLDSKGRVVQSGAVTKPFLSAMFGRLLGRVWTQNYVSSYTTKQVSNVTYADGLWVCSVDDNGLFWSNDNCKTWTQGTGWDGINYFDINAILHVDGLWVASSANHGCWWSANGKDWIQGTGDNTSYSMSNLMYADDIWVCETTANGMWWSEDGKTWNQETGASTSYGFRGTIYADDLWVSCTSHGIWWSEDGKAWTQVTGTSIVNTLCVTYADGLWVAGAYNGGCWWSANGKDWTQGTGDNTPTTMRCVTYAKGLWVAGSGSSGCWWSEDGKAWTKGTGGGTNYSVNTVFYANGMWLCAMQSSNSATYYGIWWSVNGMDWTQSNITGDAGGTGQFIYVNGLFLCAYTTTQYYRGIMWSENGKDWGAGQLNGTAPFIMAKMYIVQYLNNILVCPSSFGIWTSSIDDLIENGWIDIGDTAIIDA